MEPAGERMYSGEQTLLVTRPTRLIAFRYYVAAIFFLIVSGTFFLSLVQRFYPGFPAPAIGGWTTNQMIGAVFLFFALVFLLIAELKRKTTRYIITDNKIIREDGILNKNTEMIPYTQLERVDLHQSLSERILKIGTIVVDTGDDSLNIDKVRHPKQVQELLSNRLGRRGWSGQQPGQPPPTTK